MDPEPEKPSQEEPTRPVRLAWWFGIYFLAQLPLIKLIGGFYLYPMGLATFFLQGMPENQRSSMAFLVFVPYGIYLAHLIASLWARKAGTFIILMIVLIVLVTMNTAGCSSTLEGIQNIH
jgi:hypothetical protein